MKNCLYDTFNSEKQDNKCVFRALSYFSVQVWMKYIYYELYDGIREQKSSFNPILMSLLPYPISCLLYQLTYTSIYYFNHPKFIALLKSTSPTNPNLLSQPNIPTPPNFTYYASYNSFYRNLVYNYIFHPIIQQSPPSINCILISDCHNKESAEF